MYTDPALFLMYNAFMKRIVVGIDEAGRGPLAGPVVVAAVSGISARDLRGIRDSKQLSEKRREEWYKKLRKLGTCRVASVSASYIDEHGISKGVRVSVARLLQRFPHDPHEVLLDGSMYAPARYKQQTIIKGDENIPIISAASVIAKVTRDRRMKKLHNDHPKYDFHKHKGYGTEAHMKAIKKHGLSPLHRASFCTRIS